MAEGIVIEEKTMEQLEREVTCAVCQEYYTDPRVLPCLHYYCKNCIKRIALRTDSGRTLSCPECRYEVTIPKGGVDEFKTAFFVNQLQTTVSTMERAHGTVVTKCELCSDTGDRAEAFCRQCAMFICSDCIKQHKRLKTYTFHEVASLEDLKKGLARPIALKEPNVPATCADHEENMTIYCFDCDKLICHLCAVKDHREHNFEFCKKAAINTKKNILEKLGNLHKLSVILSNTMKEIQTIKKGLAVQEGTVGNTISISFRELREILDNRERELLGEVTRIKQEKAKKLSAQEKALSLANTEIQSIVDYTEQCVRLSNGSEIMSMHLEIQRRIEQKVEEYGKLESLEPVEDLDIGVKVKCTEALQNILQMEASIVNLPIDQTKCTVDIGTDMPEVGNEVTATLTTRLSNNTIPKKRHRVASLLKSLYNDIVTDCVVDSTAIGFYSIRFTPTIRGRHELVVSVDGHHVSGSPFPVFVSLSPTKLGQSVQIWENIPDPTGVTVNSEGDILVVTYKGNIVKLAEEGKITEVVCQNELVGLRKIEVDHEDNIYCVSGSSSRIMRCCKDYKNIQIMDCEDRLRGLALVGDKVMVCPAGALGTVKVYDKELHLMQSIQHKNLGCFLALSCDTDGNLYCADYSRSCIQVLDSDGKFKSSFNEDERGTNILKHPWGLCVKDQYVYVCDRSSCTVSVFTVDGAFVSSFGHRGNEDGQFNGPHSICVDIDGFVYVTDHLNNKVQSF